MSIRIRPTIKGEKVLLRGREVLRCDVPLGREFVQDGKTFQASLSSQMLFELVEMGDHLKYGDHWYVKTGDYIAHVLEPDMPLGMGGSKRVDFPADRKVRRLLMDER